MLNDIINHSDSTFALSSYEFGKNMRFIGFYTVSQKNIPNIFHCNLKTNYQILIICGMIIPGTTCH